MSLTKTKIKLSSDVAVFTRNHRFYLEHAAQYPKQLHTFRSELRWTSAFEAVKYHGYIKMYSAVIEGDNLVEYQANLLRVKLDPDKSELETQNMLSCSVMGTETEGLWNKSVKTLYMIRDCCKLLRPFSISELSKIEDNTPISSKHTNGYSIVFEHYH